MGTLPNVGKTGSPRASLRCNGDLQKGGSAGLVLSGKLHPSYLMFIIGLEVSMG